MLSAAWPWLTIVGTVFVVLGLLTRDEDRFV